MCWCNSEFSLLCCCSSRLFDITFTFYCLVIVYMHAASDMTTDLEIIMDVFGVSAANMPDLTWPLLGWQVEAIHPHCLSLPFSLSVSLFLAIIETAQPICCEQNVPLLSWLTGWKPKISSLPPTWGCTRNFWGILVALRWAAVPPSVAACAVDSQGRDACRDEGGNKRSPLQRSFLSHQPPPPRTPGDMKPIILMGSGSIHLNAGLHMMTMMILGATCHQLESFLAAGLERIPWEKSLEKKKNTYKKAHLVSQSGSIEPWIIYQTRSVCLCVCPSTHPFFIIHRSQSCHFLNHNFNYCPDLMH